MERLSLQFRSQSEHRAQAASTFQPDWLGCVFSYIFGIFKQVAKRSEKHKHLFVHIVFINTYERCCYKSLGRLDLLWV